MVANFLADKGYRISGGVSQPWHRFRLSFCSEWDHAVKWVCVWLFLWSLIYFVKILFLNRLGPQKAASINSVYFSIRRSIWNMAPKTYDIIIINLWLLFSCTEVFRLAFVFWIYKLKAIYSLRIKKTINCSHTNVLLECIL